MRATFYPGRFIAFTTRDVVLVFFSVELANCRFKHFMNYIVIT